MFINFMKKINQSLTDRFGKVSHTKISSYIILAVIILSSISFMVIDIMNAVNMWMAGETYEIPMSHIALYSALLTHHLFLLGIKKYSENKQKKAELDNK